MLTMRTMIPVPIAVDAAARAEDGEAPAVQQRVGVAGVEHLEHQEQQRRHRRQDDRRHAAFRREHLDLAAHLSAPA